MYRSFKEGAFAIIISILVVSEASFLFYARSRESSVDTNTSLEDNSTGIVTPHAGKINPVLFEDFSSSATMEIAEADNVNRSLDDFWWLNSGGLFFVENGIAGTVQGKLLDDNIWRRLYSKNDPRDTDNGYYPQNIFRLITKGSWKNFQQEMYFKIIANNLSISRYRNESNGLLLFNRYQDGDNLYYTGIRVDGFAVIKKKTNGKYFTMAYKQVFPGKYDRKKNPNLLPMNQWIGIRSEVNDMNDGSVSIHVFMDRNRDGNWELISESIDDGKSFGGKVIASAGYAGIRTDFMDVKFDDYRIEEMK